jgi:hypothetical protein
VGGNLHRWDALSGRRPDRAGPVRPDRPSSLAPAEKIVQARTVTDVGRICRRSSLVYQCVETNAQVICQVFTKPLRMRLWRRSPRVEFFAWCAPGVISSVYKRNRCWGRPQEETCCGQYPQVQDKLPESVCDGRVSTVALSQSGRTAGGEMQRQSSRGGSRSVWACWRSATGLAFGRESLALAGHRRSKKFAQGCFGARKRELLSASRRTGKIIKRIQQQNCNC